MSQQTCLKKEFFTENENADKNYNYSLTQVDIFTENNPKKAIQSYGIKIKHGDEVCVINDISTHKEKVENLMYKMLAGSVSPVNAKDIVCDLLPL
ncbi:MAG: DUF6514 family protein [Oscillospiraceae bacterium]|jgi:hypothetical protein|nr:DUF6514 family protein [Oscillospiraceae bacterium]